LGRPSPSKVPQKSPLGYLFGTLGPPLETMWSTYPKRAAGIFFQEAKMCPNCVTVLIFRMWPNLGSGLQTAPAPALGGGLPHLRYSPLTLPKPPPVVPFWHPWTTFGGHMENIPKKGLGNYFPRGQNVSKLCNCLHFSHVAESRERIPTRTLVKACASAGGVRGEHLGALGTPLEAMSKRHSNTASGIIQK